MANRTPNLLSNVLLLALRTGIVTAAGPQVVSAATLFTGPASPIVDLGYGNFQGKDDNVTDTHNYLDASNYGPACPQHEITSVLAEGPLNSAGLGALAGKLEALFLQPVLKESEDCLNINVQVPRGYEGKKLPVVLWIHGGGFELGSNAALLSPVQVVPGALYQGANVVKESVAINQPVIYVSANYRLNSFGFSASDEFAKAGLLNIGIRDQRTAMRWVQKNIAKFGGDPTKVTLWGESAGSYSLSAHLVANGGNNEGLFRAIIGQSGGPVKVDGPSRQQPLFNRMVAAANCSGAADKVSCLRTAPYSAIYASVQNEPVFLGYTSASTPWQIRPDGDFMAASPHTLVDQGKIADFPIMIGDMRDEGTLFTLINSLNTTTTAEFKDYYSKVFWPKASSDQLDQLAQLYPQDPAVGSRYDTGLLNAITPQYKRLSYLIGDFAFESQRRQLLQRAPGKKWTYLTENGATGLGSALDSMLNIPVLGSFHVSDAALYDFGTLPVPNSKNIMDTVISFVATLDPNNHGTGIQEWPEWSPGGKEMYHFVNEGPGVIVDDYREAQMAWIHGNADSLLV